MKPAAWRAFDSGRGLVFSRRVRQAEGRILNRVAAMAAAIIVAAGAADADQWDEARALYRGECARCHFTVEPDPMGAAGARMLPAMLPVWGPSLVGIYGRPAGAVGTFPYTASFREVTRGWTWTEETLDLLITDTRALIPHTIMIYKQPDPEVRAQIIAYLKAKS